MKKPAFTLRWDSSEKQKQVAAIARKQGNSINHIINRWADTVIAQERAAASFHALASKGDPKRLLALLDKLDAADARKGVAKTKP